MKKISLLLCVIMLASLFAGCGAKTIVGTWETDYDLTEMVVGEYKKIMAENSPGLAEVFDIPAVTATGYMTFNEDGTYSTGLEEESFTKAVDDITKLISERMFEYTNKLISDLNLESDAATILGKTEEQLAADMLAEINMQDLLAETNRIGFYQTEEDKKIFMAEKEEDLDKVGYTVYSIDGGNTLTFKEAVGLEENLTQSYPIVYKRK